MREPIRHWRCWCSDISNQVTQYGSLAKVPAEAVGNTRNDMYLVSEAIRFLMKDKESELNADEVATLNSYKGSLDSATKFIPTWVKIAVAIALGLGTMIGWKRIVVTVGEKIGKTHLTYAQGACAEITAAATIAAADGYGLPVSTTHVLSSGIAGTMAASGSGLQWSTIRNIALAWVLTLPAAMMLSGFLYFLFSASCSDRACRRLSLSTQRPAPPARAFSPFRLSAVASRRQRVLDQLDPVRGAEHDRLVVEIIGGVMQAGAVAIAAEDERARPLLQHVGEILRRPSAAASREHWRRRQFPWPPGSRNRSARHG